jgi:hypothetical protein
MRNDVSNKASSLRALFSSQIWCSFIETVFNEKPHTSFFGLGVFFPARFLWT